MFNFEKDDAYLRQKEEFDRYYNEKLLPILQENDKIRRKYYGAFIVLVLLAAVFYPAILWLIIQSFASNEQGADMGIVLGVSALVVMILRGPVYLFKKKAKKGIMEDFAGFFGSFSYQFQGCMNDALIRESDLFKAYTRHEGDDYFCGTYKDVQITVSEENLSYVTVDAKNRRNKVSVFDGICVLLSMNKNFKCRTVVLKDKGMFNMFNTLSGLERVKLEDSHFEDIFEVYSDDQIEARYLLTTAFMERMLKLRDLFDGKKIEFSFKNNQLLIAVSTRRDMFEAASFFRSNINKKQIDNVFNQFYTVFSIVDILKVNKRLGM